jgi:hypothetical protein
MGPRRRSAPRHARTRFSPARRGLSAREASVSVVLLLAAWLGAGMLLAAVVAPAAFAVLPSRTLAGALVGRVLPTVFIAGSWWRWCRPCSIGRRPGGPIALGAPRLSSRDLLCGCPVRCCPQNRARSRRNSRPGRTASAERSSPGRVRPSSRDQRWVARARNDLGRRGRGARINVAKTAGFRRARSDVGRVPLVALSIRRAQTHSPYPHRSQFSTARGHAHDDRHANGEGSTWPSRLYPARRCTECRPFARCRTSRSVA